MKRIIVVPAIVITLLVTVAYASNTHGLPFPQEVSISNGSAVPFRQKGGVSIAFDDNLQNQYGSDYVISKGVKTLTAKQALDIGDASDIVGPDFSNVTANPFPLVPYTRNPVLTASMVTDRQASFVADPFLFHDNNVWYMFFEVMSPAYGEEIGVATSGDGFHWAYQQIVLSNPQYRFSFPQVYKVNGNYYMVPDCDAHSVRLYTATNFPYQWSFVSTLVTDTARSNSGGGFADPSLFYFNGYWWMFVSDWTNSNCYLYYSQSLTSGWTQHPKSPIVVNDVSRARPAGRTTVYNNGIILHFAQKCDIRYGESVRAFQIDTLTTTSFAEHEIPESPVLVPSGSGWNALRMHTLDPWWTGNKWLASTDGDNNVAWSIGIYYRDSRDIAVTSVVPSTVQAVAGTIINISITVKNEGAMTETFNVTTFYDSNKIETQAVTSLAPGATRTLTSNWNTNAMPPGNYTIKVEASIVPNETDTADNVYVGGTVRIVRLPIASFTYYPSNPRVSELVLFDASSSTSNGRAITNYRWNFDDGKITSTPNPTTTHEYSIPRTYNVTLTVIDSDGLDASAWNSIMISAPVQTEISIFAYSSSNFVGFKVEINGTLIDPEGKGISDANIVISYTLSGVSEWVPLISATTDFEGNYYSQWIPPSIGDFTLRSEWGGNQTYAGASKSTALSIIPYRDRYIFSVASNSTISALTFNPTSQELKFNAFGPSNTTGFARVTMAKTLVANATKLKLYLDEKPLAYSTFSTGDSWVVSFTYTHSTHNIMLILNPFHPNGDVNNDGQVNMLDLSIVAVAYGSKPTDTGWNSAADLDNNGIVNIVDISIVAGQFGKEV